MDVNFEDLAKDQDIVTLLQQMDSSVNKIDDILKLAKDPELYEKLSNADKIKYNLLMSFSMNSLFWMYLRLEGISIISSKLLKFICNLIKHRKTF